MYCTSSILLHSGSPSYSRRGIKLLGFYLTTHIIFRSSYGTVHSCDNVVCCFAFLDSQSPVRHSHFITDESLQFTVYIPYSTFHFKNHCFTSEDSSKICKLIYVLSSILTLSLFKHSYEIKIKKGL
jgi:hypothetical protein